MKITKMLVCAAAAVCAASAGFCEGVETDMVKVPGNSSIKSFMISNTEITQDLYVAVVGTNPSDEEMIGETLPVGGVNWYDAIYFCNKLSILDGLKPYYRLGGIADPDKWDYLPGSDEAPSASTSWDPKSNGYRLPTKAEWIYAAKGGKNFKYSGSNDLNQVGWYNGNSPDSFQEAGTKKGNGYGLYDMSGNACEWVNNYASETTDDRFLMGGSFGYDDTECTCTSEMTDDACSRSYLYGFRIAQNIK